MKATYLTHGLWNLVQQLEAKKDTNTIAQIGSLFYKFQAALQRLPKGKTRAKEVHRLVDSYLKEVDQSQIRCKRGCSACCNMLVEVASSEADLLADRVKNGVKIDLEKIKKRALDKNRDPLSWWRQPEEQKRCIFLSDKNECRVYANRPLTCRKYYVASDPTDCAKVSQTGSIEVAILTQNMAEIVTSAFLDLERNETKIGTLDDLVYERLVD